MPVSAIQREALLNYASLQTKLNATNINALIAQYDQPDEILNLVRNSLIFSKSILNDNKSQLPYQLCGRLWSHRQHPEIAHLCDDAMRHTPLVWADNIPYSPLEQPNGTLKLEYSCGLLHFAWSPDSSRLAASTYDKSLCVWNAYTRTIIWRATFFNRINALAWSPDGQFIAAGWEYDFGSVTILDAHTGAIISQLQGHTRSITTIAWSPDGSKLATGSYDNTARVWDAHLSKELFQITKHTETVRCVAWSPDGSKLATGSHDNTVSVWDIEAQTERFNIRINDCKYLDNISDIAWSPDSRWLAIGSECRGIYIWDAHTGADVRMLSDDPRYLSSESVAWSPDGRWLAIGSRNGILRVRHVETDSIHYLIRERAELIDDVAWSPDGKTLASLSGLTVYLWDITLAINHHSLKRPTRFITCLAWSPDSTQIATGSLYTNGISLWDIQTGSEIFFDVDNPAYTLSWSPDGSKLAMGSYKGKIFNVKTGATIHQLLGDESFYTLTWSPDGSMLASNASNKIITIWDTHTWTELRLISSTGAGSIRRSVVWSPDSNFILAESLDGITSVWDVHTGVKLFQMAKHKYSISSMAWSPDGSRIVTTSFHTICIYDAKTGAELLNIPDQNQIVRDIAWSPDSHWLATGSHDNAIRLIDAKTGICHALMQMDGSVNAIAWSPDGQWLGYGCHDGHLAWMKWRGIITKDKI